MNIAQLATNTGLDISVEKSDVRKGSLAFVSLFVAAIIGGLVMGTALNFFSQIDLEPMATVAGVSVTAFGIPVTLHLAKHGEIRDFVRFITGLGMVLGILVRLSIG